MHVKWKFDIYSVFPDFQIFIEIHEIIGLKRFDDDSMWAQS